MNKFTLPKINAEQDYLKILGPAGEIFEFIRTGKSTDGKYIISKTIVPPGAGPTPHFHQDNDEWFYTPNGGIILFASDKTCSPSVELDDKNVEFDKETLHAVEMKPGELIYVPRKHFHAFVNNSNQSQLLYMIWTPDSGKSSISEYFKHVGQEITDMNNLPKIQPIAKLRFVSEAPKFGINQSHSFWQYVDKIDYSPYKMEDNKLELLKLLSQNPQDARWAL